MTEKVEFPLEYVNNNKTLLTMLCQIYNVEENFDALEIALNEDTAVNEDGSEKQHEIPVQDWDNRLIDYLMEFMKYHATNPCDLTKDELSDWDKDFFSKIETVDPELCAYLYQFANYLHNTDLIEVCAIFFAKKIEGLTVEEIRKAFHIQNDFTKEEEDEIKEKLSWIDQHK